jgi:xanthine dehydrogenase small subunit
MKSRSEITFYLNGQKQTVSGEQTLATVSDFLRYKKALTGTKVVCAEGDCGACTALLATSHETEKSKDIRFKAINTCIFPVLGLDSSHLVTIEGIADGDRLHPLQESMIKCHGSQCGFCTPGFICAMAAMTEDLLAKKKSSSPAQLTAKKVKNSLTGNLCRCTGYQPIIEAALDTDLSKITPLRERYASPAQTAELKKLSKVPAAIEWATGKVHLPTTIKQAAALKAKAKDLKIIAGATDLGVQVNKGRTQYKEVMSLQNIRELWDIKETKTKISVGARVSLARLQTFIETHDPELDRMLNLFASPQIKNTGTLVGNVVNGSPIGDMIPYLLASDAEVVAASKTGTRRIPMSKFYLGYKKLALKPAEIVVAIEIPRRNKLDTLRLFKVSLRKDLDISAVTFAMRIRHSQKTKKVESARIVFGGVGPTVKRLEHFEKRWSGQDFTRDLFSELSSEIPHHVNPISDVRGSREYRLKLCQNLVVRAAHELFDGGV